MAKKVTIEELNKKLDVLLANQQRLLRGEVEIEKEEKAEEKEDSTVVSVHGSFPQAS